jgi:uncharacterized protein with FMN-binding domain
VRSNLAAIGSVAVLTVYAVGFFKTKDAAARFAADAATRRPPRRTVNTGPQPGGTFVPATRGTSSVSAQPAAPPAAQPAVAEASPESAHPAAKPTPDTAKPAEAAAAPAASATAGADKPAAVSGAKVAHAAKPASSVDSAQTVASAKSSSSASTPLPTTPRTTAPATGSAPAPAPAPASPAAAPAADAGPAVLKDGLFYGYGTSRHGDIQAAVEILNHRILSVYITECLTQYSCSWIKNLPDEVVKLQSPETNYVSGATVSSDAFYFAVVDALKKAR